MTSLGYAYRCVTFRPAAVVRGIGADHPLKVDQGPGSYTRARRFSTKTVYNLFLGKW